MVKNNSLIIVIRCHMILYEYNICILHITCIYSILHVYTTYNMYILYITCIYSILHVYTLYYMYILYITCIYSI